MVSARGSATLLSRQRLPVGTIFALYVSTYSFGRFFIEGIRIDAAHSLVDFV
jgi:prolipoprotein diacylglyceryltransferase